VFAQHRVLTGLTGLTGLAGLAGLTGLTGLVAGREWLLTLTFIQEDKYQNLKIIFVLAKQAPQLVVSRVMIVTYISVSFGSYK